MNRRKLKSFFIKLSAAFLFIQIVLISFNFINNIHHERPVETFNRSIVKELHRQEGQVNLTHFVDRTKSSVSYSRHPAVWDVRTPNGIYCNGSYLNYFGYFAVFINVMIDPKKVKAERKGGENITLVVNQSEKMEFIQTQPGFFKLPCSNLSLNHFPKKHHFIEWEKSIDIHVRSFSQEFSRSFKENSVTFAIVRYDYANLYWVFVDIFNIFFLTKSLDLNCKDVRVLFIDAHPVSQLDMLWWNLFPSVNRIGHLTQPVVYNTLVWGLRPGDSPLMKKRKIEDKLHLNEFRNFVLSHIHDINDTSGVDCNNITVTIVFRRDYIAHARNPSGKVLRKIANEDELVRNVSGKLPGHKVNGIQIDLLPIVDQIRLASQTDILVGMHGAGLTHVMFLPTHAGLVELFPYKFSKMSHFEYIASWRHLKYTNWQNKDRKKDINKETTIVDAPEISSKIRSIYTQMCPSKH